MGVIPNVFNARIKQLLRPIKARVAMKHVDCFIDDDNSFYVLKYESLII